MRSKRSISVQLMVVNSRVTTAHPAQYDWQTFHSFINVFHIRDVPASANNTL
jgi:hypothetical protein